MNFKQFKDIINSLQIDDGAHVYIEVPLGENSFYQTPVSNTRQEQSTFFSTLIIEGLSN